ncbi:probable protein phosphatase 2C 55 [Ipomoea triloba]|uniref:probable protein phosphatase 2C 55 n=1 Tax=Ipomoea triloba TaxID=35885 RepID=UPI00125DDFC6|nr:probable protein phosphatase 2C 55 [Ipomoea triloba]XP_031104372.1 probable protein phosphatase 2C 55 [Ipomoea triloba]
MVVIMKRKHSSKPSTRVSLQTREDKGLAQRSTTKMVADVFYIPKYNPAKPLGEDSHFIFSEAQTIGVADGVGGWAKKGIDAGAYARELMYNAIQSVRHQRNTVGSVDPMTALDEAYADTDVDGSSTACILTLVDDCAIAVNVGDSGFAVLRGGRTVFRSPPQQTRFNCPVQLGKTRGDPTAAEKFEVKVKPGDIIVMATDGLFDNVYEFELLDLVYGADDKKSPLKKPPMNLARKIARYALKNSLNADFLSPFSEGYRIAGINEHAIGGKYDDITVIVAYIQ